MSSSCDMELKKEAARKGGVKHWLVGDYDWGYLCKPQWPWCVGARRRSQPQFFGRDAWLGLLTAAVMGLQHAMAMLAGLTTVPLLLGINAFSDPSLSPAGATRYQQYLISATLIVSGMSTAIQVTGIPLPLKRQWGAGILSVMGVSFSTFSPADKVLKTLIKEGTSFEDAFGMVLGTAALCALVPVAVSFLPHRVIRKVFPPVVCGLVIMLIGISLVGVGIKSWGGGAFCADNYQGLYLPLEGCQTLSTTTGVVTTDVNCYQNVPVMCSNNGDVMLPFGSAAYVGLGFSVFLTIVLLELFGSPFMRASEVILALIVGYVIAIIARYDGKKFVTSAKIESAPAITFLWVETFPLKIYGPLVLPMLIVFIITSLETVGDVTATEEASFLPTTGPSHERRIRGALLNDGINSIFSSLATSLPLTTFAQNNGVIALTGVASRQAGWACAIWLFLFGVFGKIGGIITSIPDCVFGGMTTFLFANIISSGIKIIVGEHLTRRNRVIMGFSLALGIGVTLVPEWASNNLWDCGGCSSGVKGLHDGIILILDTGFCIGAVVAIILNLLLPVESPMVVPAPTSQDLPVNNEPSFLREADFDAPPAQEPMSKHDSGAPAGTIVA